MEALADNLSHLNDQLSTYVLASSEDTLSHKPDPGKWSRKEILGHLVDSGIHNLQRFTEIRFAEQPYRVSPYQQDAWVQAGAYQTAATSGILTLLSAINHRIMDIMRLQTATSLARTIITPDGKQHDLAFLMEDYVVHFAHHVGQVVGE